MDSGEERDLVRSNYLPSLPLCLLQGTSVRVEYGEATSAANPSDAQMIGEMFPHTFGQPLVRFLSDTADLPSTSLSSNNSITPIRVGVVFCGRQSPGGHNVLWGIHNALKTHNPDSVLLGFVDGYEGLSAQKTLEITDDILSTYKNQGGCDLLFKKEDQITTAELVNAAMTSCTSLKLDGLVIIGGVTSNNYAAQLAETFTEAECPTKVVGVPVTVNGDLKNQFVETNVGFDTVCKVTSQLISNACTDALSAGKYYYFIRLMGGKASHFALECTLQSHPNMVILGEEVSASKFTLSDLIKQICDSVQARADQDKYHGVILLPEGLTGSIPEVYALLKEIHALLEKGVSVDEIPSQLSPSISALFESLPSSARDKLFLLPELDDPAQLSQIETEKILARLVEIEMNKRLKEGTYEGKKFNAICNCFGYETRGSSPSKFDCDYAFVVGHVCYHILVAGLTGYLASVTKLKNPVNEWHCGAAPITAMMTVESHGKPALHPATVDLKGKAYEMLRQNATKFLMEDVYRNLGPIQFDGPGTDSKSTTLCIEGEDCVGITQDEEVAVDRVTSETSPPSHDVTQSFDEEKTIVSEFSTHLESREEDMVAEAVEYVIVDGKDTFPSSKPEKEEASAIKDPNNCQIQDTDYMKPESNGVDLLCPVDNAVETKEEEEASLTKYPSDVPNEDEAVQKNSCETENSLNSTGDFVESEASRGDEEELLVTKSSRDSHSPEPKEDDLLCPLENAAESISEQEASVSKDIVCPVINVAEGEKTILPIKPCDCRIEDEVVQKDLSQTDNNIPEANEEEEASVTGLPCDCPILDAVVHKESSEVEVVQKNLSQNDNNIPEAKEEDEALVAGLPCDCPVPDAAVHKESSEDEVVQKDLSQNDNNIPEAKEEEETLVMGLPCDCPIPDAVVHKESSESDNYVNSPIDLMTPEIVADELLCVVGNIAEPEKEALVTEDSSDCHIQDAALLHDSSETANSCNSIGGLRTLEPDANELLCPVKNILEAEEEEEVSAVENPSDCQDANLRQDSYENGNNLHSSEDSIKSETKGGNIMSPVNNGANVQVKVTKASDEVDEISNGAEEDVEVRKASNEVDELSNGTEVEVAKPSDEVDEISTGTEVEVEVAKPSNKVDEISDGVKVEVVKTSEEVMKTSEEVNEIPNSTEGEVDVAKASDKANEISNGTEAMSCHVKGGLVHEITSSVDNIVSDSEMHNSSLNGMKVSYTNAPVISRASVQFGSFVPGIYQASVVSENDVSKPPPAAEESTAHPKVEKDVDVEVEFVVERPFNFLIRMPKYCDDELNEQIRQAEVQVTEKTQKREGIKFQMQVIRGNLQQARSDYTAKVSEERDARRLVRLKRQEIDHVQSIINRVKNAISVEDIDTRIKHMEHMMQHETLPLKEEKQFIREIKQLKLYREQLSSNMGSQDEVRKAMDEREQIEEQLKTLKKDLERLKQKVSNAEAIAVEADTKLKEEKKKLEKIYTQHGEAQNIRQEAYMNLQNLRKQFYEKNAHFRTFKDDTTAAHNYASSRDKGALHRLCLNQVEKMMELWNKDDEFRKEYVRCNTRSTLWRLRTMDGRALGPNEEQVPVGVTSFVDKSNTSSGYRVGQVNPELPLVTPEVDKREKPLSTIKAAEIPEFKSVEKVVEQTNKKEKAKKPVMENNSLPVNDSVEKKRKIVDTMEEVSNNKKQTKEEQEVNRKEEQSRNKEEEAKLKEQRRLEETAKAKEALERKRKIAEKAQIRAEARAQKEAEQKDKEKEKRAKKKERKKAGVGGEEGEIIAPASDLTAVMTVKETDTKELNPTPVVAVTAAKKPPKAFTKQHNKIKTASALPAPLRNKNKRKWQQWIWFVVGGLAVIAVVFLANMGLYPNHLGRNRYPGY